MQNEKQLTHGSLFSGIGGFDLAAEWVGWENIFHCEWNEFGQKILKYYWPKAISYGDIAKTDFTIHRGTIDVLTGGFPCQPYSLAGKRKGKDDERHLWPEMLRAIREIQPRYIVGENVHGLVNWNSGLVFDEVQTDMEAAGYEVQPVILPACAVNAPHRRDRVWFVAYAASYGLQGWGLWKNGLCEEASEKQIKICTSKRFITDANSRRQPGKEYRQKESEWTSKNGIPENWENFPTEPPICCGNDGLSGKLDGITFPKWRNESIKAYGNAIVPQVAFEIFKVINLHNIEVNK